MDEYTDFLVNGNFLVRRTFEVSEFIKKFSANTVLATLLIALTSCSYLPSFGKRGAEENANLKYEALEKKYQELLSKNTPTTSVIDKTELDSEYQKKLRVKQDRTLSGKDYNRAKIARELRSLKRLQVKINHKKYGDAILLAKELENSDVEQVRAQARFLLAKTMESQGEQIIAMQIYEEVALSMPYSIFSKRAIKAGLKLSGLINDNAARERFLLMKKPFEVSNRS